MFLSENLQEKWQPILEHSDLPKIEDNYKKAVTAVILENQEKALNEDRASLEERLAALPDISNKGRILTDVFAEREAEEEAERLAAEQAAELAAQEAAQEAEAAAAAAAAETAEGNLEQADAIAPESD